MKRTRQYLAYTLFVVLCALLWYFDSSTAQTIETFDNATTTYKADTQDKDCSLPPLQQPVSIEDFRVIGEARKGGAFQLLVRYKSLVDGSGSVTFRVPDHVAIPNANPSEKDLRYVRSFAKDMVRQEEVTVQANDIGTGLIYVNIEVPDAPVGYSRTVERWLKIQTAETTFEVFDPLNPGDRKPKEIGKDIQTFIGEKPTGKMGKVQGMQAQSSQNYTVTVSGKVRLYVSELGQYFGLYDNSVVLWFRNSSNPSTWYHPVYAPQPVEGIHYDVLDEQGNFSFNFNFTGDLTGYNELIVLVNTANNAAITPVPQDGYIEWHEWGFSTYFNESEGLQVSINPANSNISVNQNGIVNPTAGKLLRYCTLAKKYAYQLYGGNPTFTIAAIPIRTNSAVPGGVFHNDWCFLNGWQQSIEINPTQVEFTTVSHEYGHWVNYRMWGQNDWKWNLAQNELQEGWAIFYSFAARNYANRNFGDALRDNDDATEKAPFVTSPYRYYGIRYAAPNASDPGVVAAAAGCFMWACYDNVADPNFLATSYDNADNDDIRGFTTRVFEQMKSLSTTTFDGFRDNFKSGLSAELQASADKIYHFLYDNLYGIPSTKMRPAQVKNFTGTILSENQLRFDWSSASYSSNPYYANRETGYRLYKNVSGSWQLVQTLNVGTNTYTYQTSNLTSQYKLTSYNTSGDAYSAPVIALLYATMSGTSVIYHPQKPNINQYTWTANASGGTPPYTYVWKKNGYTVGSNSPTYTEYLSYNGNSCDYDQWTLRVDVTGGGSVFATKNVTEYNSCDGGGPIDPRIAENGAATAVIPESFGLGQNYPNPFNPETEITFALPEPSIVRLTVLDILGREVAVLEDRQISAGLRSVRWNGRNSRNEPVSSGMYFYRLTAVGESGKNFVETRKMLMTK